MRTLAPLLTFVLFAAPALGQEHVRASLISEDSALTPGSTHTLAVRLDIDPGWHVYWLSPGDTGLPLDVKVTKPPQQLRVGPLQWPAPRRYVHEGGELVDFVYDGPALILVPVTVSPDAQPGAKLTVKAQVSWLVCDKDACLPGSAETTLTLDVASAPGARAKHAGLIAKARATLPQPRPADLKADWDGLTLVVAAKAKRLEAFPHLPEHHPPESMVTHCTSETSELRIPYPAGARDAKSVRVLIGVFRGKSATYHWLELPPPPGKKT